MQFTLGKAFQKILQSRERRRQIIFSLPKAFQIYPEGLQVASSDTFKTAPGRGSQLLQEYRTFILEIHPPSCEEAQATWRSHIKVFWP